MGYEDRTAAILSASEKQHLHIVWTSNPILRSNRNESSSTQKVYATFKSLLPFEELAQQRLKGKRSAMYDCKVFNYSLPSKCINKLLNIIALAFAKNKTSRFLRFHFIFNNIFVVWNKLIFFHLLRILFAFCSLALLNIIMSSTRSGSLKSSSRSLCSTAAAMENNRKL
jgi:hypothetical protein